MIPRWSAALLAVLLASTSASAQLAPDKALASMKAGDGLQVELFASEPMVINPTAIDVDHLGRVWVAEAVNYRRKNFNRPILREAGDRIQILTDKDGDGKADDAMTFYQGPELYAPLSVLVLPQANSKALRVLVAQSPDILEFWDRDGDGKADGPPTKWLSGFGGYDHDHGVHGLTVGPDGKLYFTVGDAGVKDLKSKDGKGKAYTSNATDVQKGTVWRCDMDGNNLELIAHNFRNNYEACVDSFGEIWLSDNDDDGNQQTRICHVMPGGNYGYGPRGPGQSHWHEEQPGIVHKTLRTGFGSPTGICFYEGNLLPKQYQGDLIHCDAGPREVRYFKRKPKGAGYELEKTNMLTSSDTWFRPSDACVAPDGSVFVADWYDPGVGGHGMGDWTRGRIYRLTPKGHKGYKVPEVKLDTKEGRIEALKNPNIATRSALMAHIESLETLAEFRVFQELTFDDEPLLLNRAGEFFAATLSKLSPKIGKEKADPKAAQAAYAITEPIGRKLGARIRGDHLLSRCATIHFLASMLELSKLTGGNPSEIYPRIFELIAKQNSPALSREALVVSRNISPTVMTAFFWDAAKLYDGQDIFYRAALNIACGTDPVRRDAILADFEKHFPEWNDKVADLVWELRPKSMLPKLEKLMSDSKITAMQKARIVDILASSDDAAAGKTMLNLLKGDHPAEVKAKAIENLRLFLPTKWSAIAKSDELKESIEVLLADNKMTRTGLQLVSAANFVSALPDVVRIASDTMMSVEVRSDAIRTLGKLKDIKAVEAIFAIGHPENPLSLVCVQALGEQLPAGGKASAAGEKALEYVQKAVNSPTATRTLKLAAVQTLAGSRSGTGWLLMQGEKNALPKDLVADTGRLLRNSPFAGERSKAMQLFPAPGKLDPKKLPPLAELAKRTGNADNGKAIMAKSLTSEVQCMKCHMVRGQGGQIGPDLSMIGKKGSKENLFESILYPSKAIADQFVSWKLDSEDGQSITGLLVGETETTLTVRDANGKDYQFPVKGTERKKSLQSIMPEGLVATLTEDELVDVVEYLTQLQTPSFTPDSWMVMGPFASPGGNDGLDKTYGPERAFDLAAKIDGKSWSLVRPESGGYTDLAKLHGDKANNSVSFAYKAIESPDAADATVLLGTDDGATLYVNGKEIFTHKETRAASPEQNTVKVKLQKGKNEILLKIANGNNPHGFYFTIVGAPDLKGK